MTKCLAFVLGGGGARGAMQVGAVRALLEAGLKPDLLVGTSIGAVNAAGLALWGVDMLGIEALERVYQRIADSGIMDPRLAQFILNSISSRPNQRGSRWAREFMIAEGISPELHFNHNVDVRLAVVGADLDTGEPVIFGQDPGQSLLEGVMASMALPPWFAPINLGGHSIMDGGAVSNLPIEAALRLGATEIVALDLNDPSGTAGPVGSPGWYIDRLIYASARRVANLEIALAAAQGVPVHYLALKSSPSVPLWDFASHRQLFQAGYDIASSECAHWPRSINAKLADPEFGPEGSRVVGVLMDRVRRLRRFFAAKSKQL